MFIFLIVCDFFVTGVINVKQAGKGFTRHPIIIFRSQNNSKETLTTSDEITKREIIQINYQTAKRVASKPSSSKRTFKSTHVLLKVHNYMQ